MAMRQDEYGDWYDDGDYASEWEAYQAAQADAAQQAEMPVSDDRPTGQGQVVQTNREVDSDDPEPWPRPPTPPTSPAWT